MSIKGFKVNGTTYQYDYPENDNLPQINSNTLSGNKTAQQLGLVNAEQGKGLSSNDFTNSYKNQLDGYQVATIAETKNFLGIT